MRQKKEPKKKERNYSIWFTGIVLVMVYMILMDSMSGAKEKVFKSYLKEQIQELSEDIFVLMQEQEADKSCGFSNKMLQSQ